MQTMTVKTMKPVPHRYLLHGDTVDGAMNLVRVRVRFNGLGAATFICSGGGTVTAARLPDVGNVKGGIDCSVPVEFLAFEREIPLLETLVEREPEKVATAKKTAHRKLCARIAEDANDTAAAAVAAMPQKDWPDHWKKIAASDNTSPEACFYDAEGRTPSPLESVEVLDKVPLPLTDGMRNIKAVIDGMEHRGGVGALTADTLAEALVKAGAFARGDDDAHRKQVEGMAQKIRDLESKLAASKK